MPNISRSKGNQTMKLGQIIEYNRRNIFLAKPYAQNEVKILPNISRSKGNQTMVLGQIIEYNRRNIFFKKTIRKME